MVPDLSKKEWWSYLEEDLNELLMQSFRLYEISSEWPTHFHDYAFIVFPAAKAYEGFLKKFFLDLGVITEADYNGTHFRIGKSLNPDLDMRLRGHDWVYEKLKDICGGEETARTLWSTWKRSRNTVFHWFPNEAKAISRDEAYDRVLGIVGAIDMAYGACRINRG